VSHHLRPPGLNRCRKPKQFFEKHHLKHLSSCPWLLLPRVSAHDFNWSNLFLGAGLCFHPPILQPTFDFSFLLFAFASIDSNILFEVCLFPKQYWPSYFRLFGSWEVNPKKANKNWLNLFLILTCSWVHSWELEAAIFYICSALDVLSWFSASADI